jgi:hypothetical protein
MIDPVTPVPVVRKKLKVVDGLPVVAWSYTRNGMSRELFRLERLQVSAHIPGSQMEQSEAMTELSLAGVTRSDHLTWRRRPTRYLYGRLDRWEVVVDNDRVLRGLTLGANAHVRDVSYDGAYGQGKTLEQETDDSMRLLTGAAGLLATGTILLFLIVQGCG